MRRGHTISTFAGAVLAGLATLGGVSTSCQAPKPALTKVVPLVSDTCPNVYMGDKISVDWNPDFDPIWPVTGLRALGLTFAPVTGDGETLVRNHLDLGGRRTQQHISPLGNGFFHVEIAVGGGHIPIGTYRLMEAGAIPELDPDFKGPLPEMTRSPVEERYCFTFLGPRASHLLEPGD
jgi:hypothetical protein